MTQALQELGALIASKRPDCVLSYDVSFDELTIVVAPSNIVGLVDFLKSNRSCRFSTLVDITAVDYPGREKRFDVVCRNMTFKYVAVDLCGVARVKLFVLDAQIAFDRIHVIMQLFFNSKAVLFHVFCPFATAATVWRFVVDDISG